jgi:hypothetical protein
MRRRPIHQEVDQLAITLRTGMDIRRNEKQSARPREGHQNCDFCVPAGRWSNCRLFQPMVSCARTDELRAGFATAVTTSQYKPFDNSVAKVCLEHPNDESGELLPNRLITLMRLSLVRHCFGAICFAYLVVATRCGPKRDWFPFANRLHKKMWDRRIPSGADTWPFGHSIAFWELRADQAVGPRNWWGELCCLVS